MLQVALRLLPATACSTLLMAAAAPAAGAELVIPPPAYRPPETVQRVAVPIAPGSLKRLLIVSGESSYEHDWTGVNNLLRRQLLESGRFDVRVIEDFSSASADTLKPYDVVLINYLGRWNYTDKEEKRWGPVAEKALFDYVRNGGGVVIYHASFNMGSPSWPEFEHLAGGTMRPFHGSRRSPPNGFMVHVVDQTHPVTARNAGILLDAERRYVHEHEMGRDSPRSRARHCVRFGGQLRAAARRAEVSRKPLLARKACQYARHERREPAGLDGRIRHGAGVLHHPGSWTRHSSI
jgi:hypothetical protein